ncbi:MAG TPA: ATP-dependent DNA ligase, partial [Terriglobales bacterium]
MQQFAKTCEQIAGTTKKLEKRAFLAAYFQSLPLSEASVAAIFFSGRPFPMWEETTLQLGGTLLWRTVQELSGKNEATLRDSYRRHGDLGSVAGEVLPARPVQDISLSEAEQKFRSIAAARGPTAKGVGVRALLSQVMPLEAKYLIKIMTGDLRIGLKESLVEEGIAAAYNVALPNVQRGNMLLGDIGETLRLAAEGKLAEAKLRLFHPLGFMLASPAESSEDALSYFQNIRVEDKYDGIRAQAHCSGGEVKFF